MFRLPRLPRPPRLRPLAATAALACGLCTAAHAADIVFSHTGFAGGAMLEGRFTVGTDHNGDGALSSDVAGEVLSLSMAFSGNADVAAFGFAAGAGTYSLTFRPATLALTVFAYPGSGWPAPFSWDSASDGTSSPYFYSRVFGAFGQHASYTDRASGGQWTISAAPVPEPGAAALMALGLAGLLLRRHRGR